MIDPSARIHPLANVEPGADVGPRTAVWQFATVRRGGHVGADCVLGQGAFVDSDAVVGDRCKLENYASVHRGARVEDEVFLGPRAILANDHWPRATNADGSLKCADDWRCDGVQIGRRASVGAGAVVMPGVSIGAGAMIGAGAVVTRDVEPGVVAAGVPARALGTTAD